MKHLIHPQAQTSRTTDAELISAFGNALDRNYSKAVRAAQKHWERCFAGKDPSDACVSVRISGTLTRPRRPFIAGHGL